MRLTLQYVPLLIHASRLAGADLPRPGQERVLKLAKNRQNLAQGSTASLL